MIKLLVLTSAYSDVPVAQVRTDGNKLDWIVDNMGIAEDVGSDLKALQSYVSDSSTLKLKEDENPTVGLLRYLLSTGDTVEITTDGKTALLNGKLIGDQEKNQIFAGIQSGEIQVTSKTDLHNAIPLKPSKPAAPQIQSTPADISHLQKYAEEQSRAEKKNDVHYDNDLESIEDPTVKQMAYYAKYGKYKGGMNA